MVFLDDAALWHQMVYAPSEVLPLSSKIDAADEFSEKRPRVILSRQLSVHAGLSPPVSCPRSISASPLLGSSSEDPLLRTESKILWVCIRSALT